MTEPKREMELKLMETEHKQEEEETPTKNNPDPVVWHEYEYKEFGNSPKITLSGLALIILCPVLMCAHIRFAKLCSIPMIQFAFVTMLVGFLIHYTFIIRRYELMPYLPEQIYDLKLKKICVAAVIGIVWSMMLGWNGSGGILFAMIWESVRGKKFDFYGYMLLVIVGGSIAMEDNLTLWKLAEFIPGIIFGYINSTLYILKESSVYAITHQIIFLASIFIPMFFPANNIIVPAIWQWAVMILCGASVLLTMVLTVKLMQTERVSVVMGVLSGILMIGTSSFLNMWDGIGCALILVGIALLVKREYVDLHG